MNQRLGNLLDDFLVELGLAAANRDFDFLAERAGEVAHRARKRVEHRRDRQHRQLDDVLAQLFGDEVEAHAIVAEVHEKLAHAARHRVERVGVVGELRAAIDIGRVGRQARLAHAIAQAAEHALEPAQLGMTLERLETLHDHLGRQVRQPVELFNRHAKRLPQLRRLSHLRHIGA